MKKLFSLAALAALITLATLSGCKKEEQPTVNFNNATAEYIESFLGKPVDDFKKACEESGMILVFDKDGIISYKNEIKGISTEINYTNETTNTIQYTKETENDAARNTYKEYLNYIIDGNYAAFLGINNQDMKNCYKDLNEYKTSINENVWASDSNFIKILNGVYLRLDRTTLSIIFTTPENKLYEFIKSDAMSSCK